MTTTVVTTKGQIVIPSKIRQRLHIKRGTKLYIEERGEELIIKPVTPAYFEKIAGVLQTKGKLSKTLLENRAKDKEREMVFLFSYLCSYWINVSKWGGVEGVCCYKCVTL